MILSRITARRGEGDDQRESVVFKSIAETVWVFDAEWAPDPEAGRRLYRLPDDLGDDLVMAEMWRRGGATAEDPTPYLKTVLCRFLSIAVVMRQKDAQGQVQVRLLTLPRDLTDPDQLREAALVSTFLKALGERKPQLIGYNSIAADLKALVQRGIILGLQAARFCHRPNKPWEGVDYWARGSEWNIDLKEIVSGWGGKGSPSLNEMAMLSGIPGKMEVDGQQVPALWLAGRMDSIVAYNEFDALTTYLLWLRMAHFAGHFSTLQYRQEQELVRELLEREAAAGKSHLLTYLAEWRRLDPDGILATAE